MWSDNEADVDLLRFRYLASAVSRIVCSPHLLPTTVGVYGDWGCGKSTLLKMVQAELGTDAMLLTFNGWLFEGYEDAKTALMGSILDAIRERIDGDEPKYARAKEILGRLLRRVNWWQVTGTAARVGIPALLGAPHLSLLAMGQQASHWLGGLADKAKDIKPEDAAKFLKEAPDSPEAARKDIRDFRSDFAELLKESGIETLVVFIDDMDRCLPETIIETLEAIKLFLFVPGTAFVLAADERLVQYAVRQRFPELPGEQAEVGRDYLEKLVQFPVRIPPLSATEIHTYVNLLFAQTNLPPEQYERVCERVAGFRPDNVSEMAFDLETARQVLAPDPVPLRFQADLDLAAQVAPVLAPGMAGNPRRAKRFLNTLLVRMGMSEDRGLFLERRVMAKLMLLEYIRPEFFRQIAALQAMEEGNPASLRKAEAVNRSRPEAEIGAVTETEDAPGADPAHVKPNSSEGQDGDGAAVQREDTLPTEAQAWMADRWMHDWLVSEPPLAHVDLRPYFYIAHDRLGAMSIAQQRLSPAAADVLNRLLDDGAASQALGISRSEALNEADAAAVFEALATRIREAEMLDDRSPHKIVFQFAEKRPELVPQLITLYATMPDAKVPLSTPGLFSQVAKGAARSAARNQLEAWSHSPNQQIANAAKAILRRWDAKV